MEERRWGLGGEWLPWTETNPKLEREKFIPRQPAFGDVISAVPPLVFIATTELLLSTRDEPSGYNALLGNEDRVDDKSAERMLLKCLQGWPGTPLT